MLLRDTWLIMYYRYLFQNSKFKKSGKAGADEGRDITEKKYKMLVKLFWVYLKAAIKKEKQYKKRINKLNSTQNDNYTIWVHF